MSFFKEFKNYLKADNDIILYRRNICDKCPHLEKKYYKCDVCGCFMKVKTQLGFSKCPEGKW
tara:strand:- start:1331 stop:1516 length:186 start_codon:yes stop_codon:yes gene_type:complete